MASNYTYKFLYDKNGYPIYPRTSLTAIDMTLANGLATIGDKLVITYATPEQIRAGATGSLISADGLKEALEAFGDTLYTAGDGIKIEGGVISADIAPVNSILDGTIDTTKVIINKNLNGALGVGRAIDMPIHINTNGFTETTYDETRTENGSSITTTCIKLVKTSPTNGAFYYYSWNSRPAFIQNHRYLFIADIKAVTGSVRAALCANNNNTTTDNLRVFDENGNKLPAYEDDDPVNHTHRLLTTDYQRFAVITISNGQSGLFFKAVATTNIDIRLRYFKIFDVTGLSDETISALATHRSPDNSCALHLIEADAVCPWMETIALAGSSIVVQPGRSYKLTATDGAIHTLNVVPLLSDTYGKNTYITIILDNTSAIQAVQPLVIMDALKPNAANNCVIKYRDGYARLYVNDTDYGYIVTVTGSGTTNGTLYYGLFSTTEDYILFSHATDEADCVVSTGNSTIPSTTSSTRAITGNGKNTTIANFNNTQLKTGKSLTFNEITIKNVSITAGTVYADNIVLNNVTASGGVLYLSNEITVIGTFINNGALNVTNGIIDGKNSGTITYGSNSTGINASTSLVLKNVSITGPSVTYCPVVMTGSANLTMINCHVSGVTNHITNRLQASYYGTTIVVQGTGTCSVSNCVFNDCVNVRYTISGANTDTVGGAITLGTWGSGADAAFINSTTITGCTSTHAAALYCFTTNSAIISDCVMSRNRAVWYGGAIWTKGPFTITGSTISDNYSSNQGGGCWLASRGSIIDTMVTGNTAANEGGGIIVATAGVNLDITASTISSNSAKNGAGIYLTGNSTIGVYNCIIEGNVASNQGAAIDSYGSGAYCYVENCTIRNNYGVYDTVFAYTSGRVKLKNCTISGNTSTGNSAALAAHVSGAVLEAESCTITSNMSKGQSIVASGQSCSLSMLNCIIEGNTTTTYGTLIMEGVGGTMSVVGCVVKNNIGPRGRGGTFTGQNTVLNITDSIFDEDQDILFGTSSTNNCQVTISGSNVFRSSVSGTYESITISADSVIDLRNNPVQNAITGSTITTLGALTIRDNNGRFHKYLARTVNASTITNAGLWLPVTRLVITTNNVYEVQGYTISNLTTTANGVGAYITAGTISMSDMVFSNNRYTDSTWGGGIYIENSIAVISNCSFDHNRGLGASIFSRSSTITMNHCSFTENDGQYGGALFVFTSGTATMNNCHISGNSTSYGGGAVINNGGNIVLNNCNIHDNIGTSPRGIYVYGAGSTVFISNCVLGVNQDTKVIGTLSISESNTILSSILNNKTITIAAGSVIDLRYNPEENFISGSGTVSAYGKFTIINKDGQAHEYTARTVAGSTITTLGIWLPYSTRIDLTGSVEHCGYSYSGLTAATSGSVIYASGAGTKLIKDINITGCTNNATSVPANCGIITTHTSGNTVSIIGCTMTNCRCGYGNMFVTDYSNTTIENCLIYNNVATGYGGAVQCYNYAYLTMKNCEMYGNSASSGGTIMTNNGNSMTIINCYVHDNAGSTPGLYQTSGSSVVTVTGCTFGAGQTIRSEGGSFTFSGTNVLRCLVQKTAGAIIIASGAVLDLRGNANTTAISGTTITAQGAFTVIDTNGTSHSYSATSKTNSTITNAGVWS